MPDVYRYTWLDPDPGPGASTRRQAVTIRDVARAAGVSVTTVSNLLNGRESRMGKQTKDRIRRTIDELGYSPNRAAQQLRTGRTTLIGLLVPSVENPFWGGVARAIEAQALVQGQQVVLGNTERVPEREAGYVDQLWKTGVRSVVVASSLPDLRHLAQPLTYGATIVALDRESQPDDPPGLMSVSVDNTAGAQLATQHLLDLGHRRIGFLSGQLGTVSRRNRFAGYRRALAGAGIPYREELVSADGSAGFGDVESIDLAERGAGSLLALASPPTALVAINDMWALGACSAVRAAGLTIPDFSVVGFDDSTLSRLANPALTTVRQPLPEMARLVVQLLSRGPADAPQSRVVTPELIVRDSTSRYGTSRPCGESR